MQDGEDYVEVESGDDCLAIFGARRSTIDRQDCFFARASHQVNFAAAATRPRGLKSRVLDHFRGGDKRRRTIRQCPASVFFNPDSDRLVAGAVQVGEDGGRRRQRHFVFTRTSTVQHAHAKSFHGSQNNGTGAMGAMGLGSTRFCKVLLGSTGFTTFCSFDKVEQSDLVEPCGTLWNPVEPGGTRMTLALFDMLTLRASR